MGDRPPSALKSQGTFRSPFLSVRIQEERPDDGDTVIDLRGANGGDHYASSSRTGQRAHDRPFPQCGPHAGSRAQPQQGQNFWEAVPLMSSGSMMLRQRSTMLRPRAALPEHHMYEEDDGTPPPAHHQAPLSRAMSRKLSVARGPELTARMTYTAGLSRIGEVLSGSVAETEAPSVEDTRERLLPKKAGKKGSYLNEILFGLINVIVGVPTMVSYAAVVFKDEKYAPFLGQLAKLVFLASSMHQLTVSVISSIPFVIGQVQDVGLIFLSAMTTAIAQLCSQQGLDARVALGSSLLTITLATFFTGLLVKLTGYFRLATLVQYVPLPVVGGYLGYVGYFCFAAGVSLACHVQIDYFSTWTRLFNADALAKFGAAAVSVAAMWLTLNFAKHRLAFPAVLLSIPAIFHIMRLACGVSLQEAADAYWCAQPEPKRNFWEIYGLYNIKGLNLEGLYAPAMLQQLPKLAPLFFAVAFGSSLDISAIQTESPEPLDYNKQLSTIGVSNMVTACVGAGLTGSYIFSQTVFSLRGGVTSRLQGFVIAGLEILLFLIPISIVPYLPSFFFGSLLMLFGIEISLSWLVLAYKKVTRMEFILLWASFLIIMATDLQRGIVIGIVLAVLYFAWSYAQVTVKAFAVVPSRSGVLRPQAEREVLNLFGARMAAVALSGYIFFGSSLSISDQVVKVAEALVEDEAAVLQAEERQCSDEGKGARYKGAEGSGSALWAPDRRADTCRAFKAAPRFVLLDFRNVDGLDATSAQTFGTLWSILIRLGVELIITQLDSPSMRQLLTAHEVIGDAACMAFETAEEGMQYCEEQFLTVAEKYGLCSTEMAAMSLAEVLALHTPGCNDRAALEAAAEELRGFLEEVQVEEEEALFEMGAEADELFILIEGSVEVEADFVELPASQEAIDLPAEVKAALPSLSFVFGPGSILGAVDFYLGRVRRTRAQALQQCTALQLMRGDFDEIAASSHQVMAVLCRALLHASAMDASHMCEHLARNSVQAS